MNRDLNESEYNTMIVVYHILCVYFFLWFHSPSSVYTFALTKILLLIHINYGFLPDVEFHEKWKKGETVAISVINEDLLI